MVTNLVLDLCLKSHRVYHRFGNRPHLGVPANWVPKGRDVKGNPIMVMIKLDDQANNKWRLTIPAAAATYAHVITEYLIDHCGVTTPVAKPRRKPRRGHVRHYPWPQR